MVEGHGGRHCCGRPHDLLAGVKDAGTVFALLSATEEAVPTRWASTGVQWHTLDGAGEMR